MRILIKGGIWKNTEDEILKAAVMKYGKNQWARAASLLNRKSAKQCKARWYEWLDPSIKKTEWSREEEEKLLHLAKLMPNQWRTIAPIVGRTAGQCMEQYEKLLDKAQEELGGDSESAEDARKLRPGEIDPAPETKPARPDPIDMDEDEKEMLSEARARLANTKGKKAKRKARERLLDESKRLAVLQKRRELKAAGIESHLRINKRKFIDYSREIPFQKVPPAGFYDVSEENRAAKRAMHDPKQRVIELAKLEGKHEKEEEERLRQMDKRKLKTILADNAPLAIMKVSEQNDPSTLRVRPALNLPAPQVSDAELEEIVKVGQYTSMGPPVGLPSKASTQALLGDYSKAIRATPTPMRTPLQENIIMQEARNLRALRAMAPLSGEELPEMFEGTGFEGATPRISKIATPNILVASTPGAVSVLGGRAQSRASGGGATVSRTPLRDQLGLNDPHADAFSVSDAVSVSSTVNRSKLAVSKSLLSQQLKSLPEPEYTYEISVPTTEEEVESADMIIDEDAADVEEREKKRRQEEMEAELRRRSSVVKRSLPRPSVDVSNISLSPADTIQAMIQEEMLNLIAYDQYRYPEVDGKATATARPIELETLPDEYLARGREAIIVEYESSRPTHEELAAIAEKYATLHTDFFKQNLYLPTKGEFGIPENKSEMLSAFATQFNVIKSRVDKDAKKASKLESKLQITTQGYLKRADTIKQQYSETFHALDKSSTELDCYSKLFQAESQAIPNRLEKAKKEMADAEHRERILQQRFAKLKDISKEA